MAEDQGGGVAKRGPGGRPSTYDPAVAEAICDLVATSDVGLHHVLAARDDLPGESTIYKWLRHAPEFAEQYAHARERQGLRQGDMAVQEALLATDPALGRLRYDARRWQASKLAARQYGDRVALTNRDGTGDATLRVENVLVDELATLLNVTPSVDAPRALPDPSPAPGTPAKG